MAEYLIQGETLTELGDKIRVLSGTEGTMLPSEMIDNVQSANDEVATQTSQIASNADLIAQIKTALDGKAAGSGSGSSGSEVSFKSGNFTYILTEDYEPGADLYVLTADDTSINLADAYWTLIITNVTFAQGSFVSYIYKNSHYDISDVYGGNNNSYNNYYAVSARSYDADGGIHIHLALGPGYVVKDISFRYEAVFIGN